MDSLLAAGILLFLASSIAEQVFVFQLALELRRRYHAVWTVHVSPLWFETMLEGSRPLKLIRSESFRRAASTDPRLRLIGNRVVLARRGVFVGFLLLVVWLGLFLALRA